MVGQAGRSGGWRKGAGRKLGDKSKDPRAVMKDMGYTNHWLSPVEFCLAVMNNDATMIHGRDPVTNEPLAGKDPTIGQRIEAARILAPYMHQKLPELVEQNVTHSWADVMQEAEIRASTMRKPHEPGSDSTVH